MSMSDTISVLNRLTRLCRDCEQTCESLARAAPRSAVAGLLQDRAQEWGRQGDELQALVLLASGTPVTTGSLEAALQRALWRLQGWVSAPAEALLLRRWQALQQQAAGRYETALGAPMPERMRRTVALQAQRVRARCAVSAHSAGAGALHLPTG